MIVLSYRQYTRRAILISGSTMGLLCMFAVTVDPNRVLGMGDIPRVNSLRVENGSFDRIGKAIKIEQLKPDGLILGSSSAEMGFDPDHGGWNAKRVFNAASTGMSIREIGLFLKHAQTVSPLKEAVVTLNFRMANVYRPDKIQNYDLILRGTAKNQTLRFLTNASAVAENLFSIEALASAAEVVMNSYLDRRIENRKFFENGMRREYWKSYVLRKGQRQVFIENDRDFANKVLFPAPLRKFCFADTKNGKKLSALEEHRALLRYAYSHGVRLHLVFPPRHARIRFVVYKLEMWPRFGEFARFIVAANAEEARRAGRPPYPIWSFLTADEYTGEKAPPPTNRTTIMNYYYDTAHFRQRLGNLALDRMFGLQSKDSFGVRLTDGNVEEHMKNAARSLEVWAQDHPDEAAEIEDITRPLLPQMTSRLSCS